jgi:hypothetical protein
MQEPSERIPGGQGLVNLRRIALLRGTGPQPSGNLRGAPGVGGTRVTLLCLQTPRRRSEPSRDPPEAGRPSGALNRRRCGHEAVQDPRRWSRRQLPLVLGCACNSAHDQDLGGPNHETAHVPKAVWPVVDRQNCPEVGRELYWNPNFSKGILVIVSSLSCPLYKGKGGSLWGVGWWELLWLTYSLYPRGTVLPFYFVVPGCYLS